MPSMRFRIDCCSLQLFHLRTTMVSRCDTTLVACLRWLSASVASLRCATRKFNSLFNCLSYLHFFTSLNFQCAILYCAKTRINCTLLTNAALISRDRRQLSWITEYFSKMWSPILAKPLNITRLARCGTQSWRIASASMQGWPSFRFGQVAACSAAGWRVQMEDTHTLAPVLNTKQQQQACFAAVCESPACFSAAAFNAVVFAVDGHSGDEAANFCRDNMLSVLHPKGSKTLPTAKTIQKRALELDKQFLNVILPSTC